MNLAERITEYLEWPKSHHAANSIIIELMEMLDYADDQLKDILKTFSKNNKRD